MTSSKDDSRELPALAFGVSVAALVHPSLTLQAAQSAMVGVLLTALVALMQRLVGGRHRPALLGDPTGRASGLAPGSSLGLAVGAGSDDSTAIRPRPVSTMDYVVPPPAPPSGESVPGSTRHRLRADESGYSNLFLAGDWVYTAINAGCIEAAVMGGFVASRAICGYPKDIIGELD